MSATSLSQVSSLDSVLESRLMEVNPSSDIYSAAAQVFEGMSLAEVQAYIESSYSSKTLQSVANDLIIKSQYGQKVTLADVSVQSQRGVNIAGGPVAVVFYTVAVLGWIYFGCRLININKPDTGEKNCNPWSK